MLLEVEPIIFSYEMIFRECVSLLYFVASVFNTSYEAINIWIFCIIWPILFVLLIARNIYLKRRLKSLKLHIKSKPLADKIVN
jgi:hypothetical protein